MIALNSQVNAQKNAEQIKHIESRILMTIMGKCHLTILSTKHEIQINSDTLYIPLNFDNESLRTFWSPEVAVEYIFDAALAPIINMVWNEEGSGFDNYKKLVFYIDIQPRDIPPALVFEISIKDWQEYLKDEDKVALYEKLKITSAGLPYSFDGQKAVEVE